MSEVNEQLFGDAEQPEATPAIEVEPQVEAQEAPQTEAAPAVETKPAAEPAKPEPQMVPIYAVHDERERRQKAERELEQIKAQQAEKPKIPDSLLDPEGHARWQQEQLSQMEARVIMRFSGQQATKAYGHETVQKAETWMNQQVKSNPGLAHLLSQQSDPYDFAVKEYRKHEATADVTDWSDPVAAARAILAKYNASEAAPAAQPSVALAAAPKPAFPAPSIADVPSLAPKQPSARADAVAVNERVFG